MVTYELWDLETHNLLAVFARQDEALAQIRADLQAYGRPAVERLLLGRVETDGRGGEVATGAQLSALAEAAAAPLS